MGHNEDARVSQGQTFGLIEQIYATVDAPELWREVISEISVALCGESIALFANVNFPEMQSPALLTMNAAAEGSWSVFAGYYAAVNPIMPRVDAKFLPGTTCFSHQAISDAELERTEFYTDFYGPNGMHHTVGLRIPLWGSAAGALSCQRPKAAGVFGAAADDLIQTLKPHLQRALALRHKMATLETQTLGLGAALESLDHGVLCLTGSGRVGFANAAAETILREENGLRLAHGRLAAKDRGYDAELQRILRAATGLGLVSGPGVNTDSRKAAPGSVLLGRADRGPLRVTAAPLRTVRAGLGEQVAAVVFLYDADRRPVSRSELMVSLYGLTPTEARMAAGLVAGREVREIAEGLGMTFETARFHVKRVLGKTGTRRQAELLRLMLTLPGQ